MKLVEQLHIIFNIRKGEGWTVSRMLLFSFFQNMGLALLFATANVLYLSNVPIETLPYVYIATAVLMLVLEFIYERLEHVWTISRIILAILIGLTVSMLVFRFALQVDHADAPWLLFALIVWERVAALTTNSEFGKANAMLFDIRQSKRLFGLLGATEIPARIIGVLLAPILISFIPIEELLIGSAIFFGISIIFFWRVTQRHQDKLGVVMRRGLSKMKEASKGSKDIRDRFLSFFGSKYVIMLALFTFCLVGTTVLIEYAFLVKVESAFDDQTRLAYFFGIFFAAGEAIVFVVKTFFSGRILNKYGLNISLNMLPLGLFVFTALFFMAQLFSTELHLWFIGFMMLYSSITKSSLTDPAFFSLFQPLAKKLRFEGYNAVGIVENISYGIAGVTLIALVWVSQYTDASPIVLFVMLLVVILAAAMLVLRVIHKLYQSILERALKNRNLEGSSIELRDANSTEILIQKLKSPHIGEVLYALNLLVKFEHDSLEIAIPKLLYHSSIDVQAETLRVIEEHKLSQFAASVKELIAQQNINSRIRSLAIRAYTYICEDEFFEEVIPYLDESDELVKMGAMIGLIRSGGISGVIAAGERLIELTHSPLERDRKFAAFIVGEVGIKNFYQPLVKLLQDPSEEVVEAALNAAGKIRNARLARPMIEQLAQPKIFESAGRSLIRMGPPALPYLQAEFEKGQTDLKRLRRAAYVSGRIGGIGAIHFLKDHINIEQPAVRNQVLESLDNTNYKALQQEHSKILDYIKRELEEATLELFISRTLKNEQIGVLLVSALEYEVQQTINRLLLLLSFIYNAGTIHKIKENLFLDEKEKKANAIEMLDVVLPSTLKRQIFPLLEDLPLSQKLDRLLNYFPQPIKSAEEFIKYLISPKCRHINDWTKAVAIYTTKDFPEWKIDGVLVNYIQAPQLLVQETTAIVLHLLNPNKLDQLAKYAPKPQRGFLQSIQKRMESEEKTHKLFQIEKVLLLKTVSIFKDTSEEILAEIAGVLQEVELSAGETVFHKGDEGDCMYIIFDGKVKVHDGDSVFANFGVRDFFGELSLLDPEPRSASITALEDTFLLQLHQDAFYEIMADRIEVVRGILKILVRRLRDQNNLITGLKGEVKELSKGD